MIMLKGSRATQVTEEDDVVYIGDLSRPTLQTVLLSYAIKGNQTMLKSLPDF